MAIATNAAPGLSAADYPRTNLRSARLRGQRTTTCAERSVHRGLQNRVVLARIGPVTLVNFGLLAAAGGALAAWVALARQQQAGMQPEGYAALLFGALPVLAVIGSRAFSLVLGWRGFVAAPLAEAFKPGFAFHGGLIAATAGVVGIAMYAHVDLLMLLDAMALGFPLGHAVGRLACHTYGCCHGRPTRSRLAIRYTSSDSKAVWCSGLRGIPLHPTQLYSAAGNLALFAFLTALAFADVRTGQLAGTYLVVGSTGRFLVEFLRGEPTSRTLGLTPFQWVSIGLLACGLGLLHIASGHPLHGHFADPAALLESLRYAAFSIYPLWVFVVIFVCFGVQGRQVGSFGSRPPQFPRSPH
jgi:phosphatidylglycerol:prolipoprotein diacylglycerol transferase